MHVHTTRYSSQCSVINPYTLLNTANIAGLDGVVISEHQCRWGDNEINAITKNNNIIVLPGREISISNTHILIYGDIGLIPNLLSPIDFAKEVDNLGGAVILAHPFRFGITIDFSIKKVAKLWESFHGIEALTGSHKNSYINKIAMDVANNLNIPIIGGSDAHIPSEVGLFYTYFNKHIKNEHDLVYALRNGNFTVGLK